MIETENLKKYFIFEYFRKSKEEYDQEEERKRIKQVPSEHMTRICLLLFSLNLYVTFVVKLMWNYLVSKNIHVFLEMRIDINFLFIILSFERQGNRNTDKISLHILVHLLSVYTGWAGPCQGPQP